MNSALLTARRQHEIVPATGDRDGHDHDALGAHQDPEHGPGDLPPHGGWPGQALVIGRARLWSAHDRLPSVPCRRPGLRRDQEVALYRGDPGRRGCSRPGRARLVQRVHVPVELRRVVGYLDPDVAGIDLRFVMRRRSGRMRRSRSSSTDRASQGATS
jgi:hypothetical protein